MNARGKIRDCCADSGEDERRENIDVGGVRSCYGERRFGSGKNDYGNERRREKRRPKKKRLNAIECDNERTVCVRVGGYRREGQEVVRV